MAMQTGLEGKPWWQGAAAGAVVAGLVLGVVYWLVASPRYARQEGRPVEVEAIWGEPWRQGVAAGAAMPRLEMLYHLLRRITA